MAASFAVHAQPHINIDSLKREIQTNPSIFRKIDAINAYAYELRRTDTEKGTRLATLAHTWSLKYNYHTGIGDYYNCIGAFINSSEQPDSALYLSRRALEAYEKGKADPLRIARVYNRMSGAQFFETRYDSTIQYARRAMELLEQVPGRAGRADAIYLESLINEMLATGYYNQGRNDSSLYYYIRGEKSARKTGDTYSLSFYLVNKANIYNVLDEFEMAIRTLHEALPLKYETEDKPGVVLALTNLAHVYQRSGQAGQARMYVDSALKMGKEHGIFRNYGSNYRTLGRLAYEENNCRAAEEYHRKGLVYAAQYNNKYIQAQLYLDLGEALRCQKRGAEAIPYYELAIEEGAEVFDVVSSGYWGLADAYEQTGNYKAALQAFRKYTSMKDSVYNKEKALAIFELNTRYETSKKEDEIKLLAKEKEIQALLTEKEIFLKRIAYGSILALLLLGVFLFYRYRQRKTLEKDRAVLTERLRIARDLHDDMGATASSISVYSTAVRQKLSENKVGESALMLDRIGEHALEMVDKMGDMVWTISPHNDTLEQLGDRLHAYGSGLLQTKEMVFTVHLEEELNGLKLDMEVRKNIFLLFKEALNNAAKYSEATEVMLEISRENSRLDMTMTDNGRGFETGSGTGGNGLRNMRERAAAIGASLTIRAEPGEGTRISLVYPLPKIGD